MATYSGSGVIASSDYHAVKWVGKDKSGAAVTINLSNALNMGNIDWTFADKDDTVAQVVFTSVYTNTDAASDSNAEPWSVEVAGTGTGASSILLGAGIFYIDEVAVGLTRGGGSFNVTREFRNINADGDRGAVKGRIVIDASEATLTVNALEVITNIAKLYPAVSTT